MHAYLIAVESLTCVVGNIIHNFMAISQTQQSYVGDSLHCLHFENINCVSHVLIYLVTLGAYTYVSRGTSRGVQVQVQFIICM